MIQPTNLEYKSKEVDERLKSFLCKSGGLKTSPFPRISAIPISSIRSYNKFNFLHIHKSFEIKLRDHSTFEFAFSSEVARDKLLNGIIANSAFKISVLAQEAFALENKSGLTYKWLNGRLSNFAYLMAINKLGGRSIRDISRHPFLPWCLVNMETETISLHDASFFRDLSKPIGYMVENERTAALDHKFKCMQRDKNPHPHHFDSFVSNTASSLLYLAPLLGKMAEADQFYSLPRHYKQLQTSAKEIKECVPEFYYMPEVFPDAQTMGGRSTISKAIQLKGNQGIGMEFPAWTKPATPACFVYLHRLILECPAVSERLHHWIDLHFGVQAKGAQSVASKNTYPPQCSAGTASKKLKESSIENKVGFLQVYSEVYHGGQIPAQIFWTEHPAKNLQVIDQVKPRCFSNKQFKPYIVSMVLDTGMAKKNIRGCCVEYLDEEIVVCTTQGVSRIKASIGRNPKNSKVEKLSCTLNSFTEINKLLRRLTTDQSAAQQFLEPDKTCALRIFGWSEGRIGL